MVVSMEKYFIVLSACTNPEILKVYKFLDEILKIVCVIIPAVLIVMLSLDLFKALMSASDDSKKNINIILKRVIYCICFFLVPTIVDLTLNIVDESASNVIADYQSCSININNISYFEELQKEKQEQFSAKMKAQREKKFKELYKNLKIESNKLISKSNGSGETTIGSKYPDLTDEQIRRITAKCISEQGANVAGVQAEASLLVNRFEMYGSKYGTGGTGMVNYLSNSGWWSSSSGNFRAVTTELTDAVKQVLVNGNRTLALYVDEHDCFACARKKCKNGNPGDICSISLNGQKNTSMSEIKNRGSYIKDKTVIYNLYGSVYTFYSFPTNSSGDPFGYTATAVSKFNKNN